MELPEEETYTLQFSGATQQEQQDCGNAAVSAENAKKTGELSREDMDSVIMFSGTRCIFFYT